MNIENSALKKVIGAYFMALTIMMYYFLNSTLEFGLSITYRHLFALIIIFSGILYFLARPNLARASVAVKSALVVSVPNVCNGYGVNARVGCGKERNARNHKRNFPITLYL